MAEYQDDQPPGPFLRRKLAEGGAHVVELLVLGVDGSQSKVDSWPASMGLDDLRDEIESRSVRHASLGPSLANFIVRVLDAQGQSMGFDSFRVSATIAAGRSQQLMSEPANDGGVIAQMMRHNESILRLMVGNTDRILHHANERLEKSEKRASSYEETHLRLFEALQDIDDRKATRERETRKLEAGLEMKREAFTRIKELAPVVFDAVAGRTPQGAQAAAVLLAKEVFSSIRPEQFGALMATLDQEQQMKLLALYKRFAQATEDEGKGHAH